MTSEQLEAARAERMRQNGYGALTLEDARTWLEETGLCLFLPKRQFSSSLAPSFVEAVAGQRNTTPEPKQIAAAEALLVRLELDGVAVRLNLLGQPGEQPDYVVAAWVLPYVYALRGDRDWRRSPQLTGSRQVSPLAIQAYKRLETGDATIAELKQSLGQGVSEMAVLRAITELWQQLRIIPVISAPGEDAQWQLLRQRFQKAIAEGASTSQVTAISVLASIFLQAVIAATMEEVEIFLSPLTARSKIREVLRGLVATRQVHTLALGHAPHFYVAGTLPEFAAPSTVYASSAMSSSGYFGSFHDHEEGLPEPVAAQPVVSRPVAPQPVTPIAVAEKKEPAPAVQHAALESHSNGSSGVRKSAPSGKSSAPRPHFSRPAAHGRDRKPAAAGSSRPARRSADARTGSRPATQARPAANGSRNGHSTHAPSGGVKTAHSNGNGHVARTASAGAGKTAKTAAPSWSQRNGSRTSSAAKPGSSASARKSGLTRTSAATRTESRAARNNRKPALASGSTGRNQYSAKQGNKKRG